MRLPIACAALALLALPTLVSGSSGGGRVKSGPATIPYLCHDGQSYDAREAVVVYENGSDYLHAKAQVTYDGRTTEMRAAPTLYGVRYRTEAQPAVAWTLRGEDAWLTDSPDADGYTRPERQIARCIRLREEGPNEVSGVAPRPAGEEHSTEDHGDDH
ncbi:MAG: hypothetical protein ACXWU1_10785 [Allosphingosinicella sp.]